MSAGAGEFESLAESILSYSPECIKVLDLDGRLLHMNENGQRLLGIGDFETVRGSYWPDMWLGTDRDEATHAVDLARRGEAARFVGFFTTLRGEPKWWDVVVTGLPGTSGAPEHLIAVSRDITDQRRSEGYFRFLAEIGVTLDAAFDAETMLRSIAGAIVRSVADFCSFDMVSDAGAVERVVYAHRDPDAAPAMARINQADPGRPGAPQAEALRTLRPVLVQLVPENATDVAGGDPDHAALWTGLGITSIISVPMTIGSVAIGAMSLAVSGRPYGFDERDVALAEEVGRRVASAIRGARRFEHERFVATTLQAAAIPRELPLLPDVAFDAIYVPASSEAAVGGDWYDAFELPDGRIVVTIGDVMGHGIAAAVTMGAIRQSMRAAAMMQGDPTRILDIADRTLRLDDPGALATALVAVMDRKAMTLQCSLAGHPVPVVRRADGTVLTPFASGGLMLGMRMAQEPPAQTFALSRGDLAVFVTDGALEQSHDIRAGEAALAAALARSAVYGAVRPAHALLEALDLGATTDDLAILAMRLKSV